MAEAGSSIASSERSSKWSISINTEIFFMVLIGMASLTLEESLLDVKATLGEVWSLPFPDSLFSKSIEQLIKSLMSSVILSRAFTIHIYLASYLLLLYPVFMEKKRLMLVFWLTISFVRSIIINALATLSGWIICCVYDEMKPACFEFSAIKGVEMACSAYMWTTVHEFYYFLKNKRRTAPRHGPNTKNLLLQERGLESENSFSDSFIQRLMGDKTSDSDESDGSISSLDAQEIAEWFMTHVKGYKNHECIKSKRPLPPLAEEFLNMTPEEVAHFQTKLRFCLLARDKDEPFTGHCPYPKNVEPPQPAEASGSKDFNPQRVAVRELPIWSHGSGTSGRRPSLRERLKRSAQSTPSTSDRGLTKEEEKSN